VTRARKHGRLQICSQYTVRRIRALVCFSIRYKFVGYIGAGVPRARRWFAWLQISMGYEKDYKRKTSPLNAGSILRKALPHTPFLLPLYSFLSHSSCLLRMGVVRPCSTEQVSPYNLLFVAKRGVLPRGRRAVVGLATNL